MLVLAALIAAAAPAPTIIVTGRSLGDTETALEQCLARRCPPEEDIRASLAHAENLFVAGDYDSARRILKRSIARNGNHGEALPIPVSNLYRASGRVAAHLGEGEDYVRSTYRTWSILRDANGVPAWLPLSARMDVANMITATQGARAGKRAFGQLEEEALQLGRPDIAALARLRGIWVEYRADPSRPVERQLRGMLASSGPEGRIARTGALILLARVEREKGVAGGGATDALVAELARSPTQRPTLLYAPPLPVVRGDKWWADPARVPVYSVTSQLPTENFEDRWVDIGFWVQPDGRVDEAEVLRQSGSPGWVEPVLASVAGRVYAPLTSGEGHYRVERFTYTSNWRDRIDTRLRVRSQDGTIHSLDLTADPDARGS
jgi:hypothetical protein